MQFHLQHLLFLAWFLTSFCACDRTNSKKLQWQDRSNSKRLRWDEDPEDSSLLKTKGERGLTFINNEAYSLSRKHQKMMWDLYLRKGYAPSLSDYDDDHLYGDLSPSSPGYRAGTATLVDPSSDLLFQVSENSIGDYGVKKQPDVIASRILDNYELSKSPRGVPEVENEILSSAFQVRSTQEPNTEPPAVDKLASGTTSSVASFLSGWWDSLKDSIGELLGREMQQTILNTIWSWWTSLVEFVNSRGKRSVQEFLAGPERSTP